MSEGDSINNFLTKIKDIKEIFDSVDEINHESALVSIIVNTLPDSY